LLLLLLLLLPPLQLLLRLARSLLATLTAGNAAPTVTWLRCSCRPNQVLIAHADVAALAVHQPLLTVTYDTEVIVGGSV
jgi:hypothetical protein